MRRVLVVDDDPDVLDALTLALEDEGYNVAASERGEYVEDLRGMLPEIIILDVLLSGRDGRILCRKLKADVVTRDIPVVMISAHPNVADSVKEAGADAFLAKPFAIEKLLETVERLVN